MPETEAHEPCFRYIILALNAWARPETIIDLSVSAQVDFESGLIYLNPPGRIQNKKVRPTIRLTDDLCGWLNYWNLDRHRRLAFYAQGIGVARLHSR